MGRARRTWFAALAVLTVVPAIATGAAPGGESVFLHGAALLQEEADLLPLAGPNQGADPDFAANRGRLEYVDGRGAAILAQMRAAGVRPSDVLARTLGRLPVPTRGEQPPSPNEYRSAIAELRALHASRGNEATFAGRGDSTPSQAQRFVSLPLIIGVLVAALSVGLSWRARRRRGREGDSALIAMAMTDALTGTANRHRLDLDAEAMRREARSDVSVIMLDIDHFKAINDHFGHSAGDDVLRRVGRILFDHTRGDATVYRYGGEEFCVILRGASLAAARMAADRLRATVSRAQMPTGASVTVSLGVAAGSSTTLTAVIERADAALYAAKRAGRDRVEVAGERPAEPAAAPALS